MRIADSMMLVDFFMVVGSLLPLGAIVGIVIGSLIAVVVFAGIFGAVLRKRICEPRHYLRKPKS